MAAPFIAETTFHVRYAETDAQGIVHHASYVVYFEEGRSEFIRQRGSSYADFERSGLLLAVTDLQVRYIRAARYDDRLTVRTWLAETRSRTLMFQYQIIDAASGTEIATAQTKHVCLNRDGQIARIPESWLQSINSTNE